LLNYGQCWKVTKVTPNSSDNGPTGTTAKGCTGAAFTFTRVELSNVACPESPLAPNYTGL